MAWSSSHRGGVCCIIGDINCLGQFKEKQLEQREQIRPNRSDSLVVEIICTASPAHRPRHTMTSMFKTDRRNLALNPFRPITLSQPFHSHPTHHVVSHASDATSSCSHPVPGIDKPVSPQSTLATPRPASYKTPRTPRPASTIKSLLELKPTLLKL
jgi:hypothetical protein